MLAAFLPETLVERIGWLLVHSVWQFALVALVLAAVLQAMRRRSANARYCACVLAWAAIATMPAVTWMLLPASAPDVTAAAPYVPLTVEPVSPDGARPIAAPMPEEPAQVVPAETRWAVSGDPTGPVEAGPPVTHWWVPLEASIAPWLGQLVALWCFGVLLFALRPAWGWYTVQRLKRRGTAAVPLPIVEMVERGCRRLALRQNVRVLQSALVGAPVVVGSLRPLILLPLSVVNGLSPTQLEAILAHELAHIRRHDYLVNLLQTLSETIFFYHPALWWVSSRIRHEREHCCDELAAEALGSRVDYGRALLALAELRGAAPVLSLGAKGGSLLARIRRLAGVEPIPRWNAGGTTALALLVLLLIGLGLWTAGQGGAASEAAEPETIEDDQRDAPARFAGPADQEDAFLEAEARAKKNSDSRARELALRAHAQAAAIDRLSRLYLRAHGRTETEYLVESPSEDPLKNLIRALDPAVPDEDWFRYEELFAWDEKHFVIGHPADPAAAPDRPESWNADGTTPFRHVRWGRRDLSGSRSRGDDGSARHVLRANAAEMWKTLQLTSPNYLLATSHEFWWGDNGHQNQHFSNGAVPRRLSTYRYLGREEFDGEACDVVESPTRFERLWISRRTGLIRGFVNYRLTGPITSIRNESYISYYKSEAIRKIAGRSFETYQEFANWHQNESPSLPARKRLELALAWSDYAGKHFGEQTRPGLVVRFRDFREIAPGIWLPFREDRAQGSFRENRFECIVSNYTVHRIRTDFDLSETVKALLPKDGERVQDQRYAVPVNYEHRADRTEAEIRELVDAEYRKLLEGQQILNRLKEPIDKIVGRPAPPLPEDGWVGGGRPDVSGTPYLVHFWAAWCGPCKNDFEMLKRMAERGDVIIGMHPAGTPAEEVREIIDEFELGYPTFLDSRAGSGAANRSIAGYPAGIFPYCILVDAQGNVAAHGSLHDQSGEVLGKFWELRAAANERSAASEAPQLPQQPVTVRCLDAEGKPVAGAEVHLFQYDGRERRYVHSGPFTSDEQGRVVSDEALFSDELGHFDRWVYARVPGRLVGVARSAKWKNRQVVNQDFRVELQPSRSVEGQVTVPEGFDPADVTVRVQTLHVFTGRGDFDFESFPREDAFRGLDTALPEIFESRPDAEGRVRLNDVPVRGRLYLVTTGQGLGEAQWRNSDNRFDEPIRLTIEKEGSLTGLILAPDGKPAAGMNVAARLSSGARDGIFHLSTFRAVTGEEGEFTVRGLPDAAFVLSVEDPQERWVFRPRENLLVEPGEMRALELRMETGVVVSGRVLDPDGRPVQGAAFSALVDTRNGPGLAHATTDADGRYEFRLPLGAAQLYFNSLPEGFAYPDPQIVKRLDLKAGQAAIEDLDFTLQRKPAVAKVDAQKDASASPDGVQRFELLVRGPDGKAAEASSPESNGADAAQEVARLESLWDGWRDRTKTLHVEGRRLIGICQKPETAVTRSDLMSLISDKLVPMLEAGRPETAELDRLTEEMFPEGAAALNTHGRASRGWESFAFLSGAGGRRADFGTPERSHVLVRKDGREQRYDSTTGQAGLFPAETSLHMETLETFLYTPQLTRIPSLRAERIGKRQRLANGRFILEYDSDSGLPYRDSRLPFFERIQELPLPSDEGVVFAQLMSHVLYNRSSSDELLVRRAFIYLLDSTVVNRPVTDESFEIAVPARSTIVDFGTELPGTTKDGRPRHAARRVNQPVEDISDYIKHAIEHHPNR